MITKGDWISVKDRLPKSDVEVLAVIDTPVRAIVCAFYAAKFAVETDEDSYQGDDLAYVESTGTYFLPKGWYEYHEYEETNWHISDNVTHWMPMPELPERS